MTFDLTLPKEPLHNSLLPRILTQIYTQTSRFIICGTPERESEAYGRVRRRRREGRKM